MTEIISHPIPADPRPAELVRAGLCPMCWSPPGRPCTFGGTPGDHLARYIEAVKLGLLSAAELGAAIAGVEVLADHVILLERAA